MDIINSLFSKPTRGELNHTIEQLQEKVADLKEDIQNAKLKNTDLKGRLESLKSKYELMERALYLSANMDEKAKSAEDGSKYIVLRDSYPGGVVSGIQRDTQIKAFIIHLREKTDD